MNYYYYRAVYRIRVQNIGIISNAMCEWRKRSSSLCLLIWIVSAVSLVMSLMTLAQKTSRFVRLAALCFAFHNYDQCLPLKMLIYKCNSGFIRRDHNFMRENGIRTAAYFIQHRNGLQSLQCVNFIKWILIWTSSLQYRTSSFSCMCPNRWEMVFLLMSINGKCEKLNAISKDS